MRLIRDNVEREVDSAEKAAELMKKGFRELGAAPGMPNPSDKPKLNKGMSLAELRTLAEEKGLDGYESLNKGELLAVLKESV